MSLRKTVVLIICATFCGLFVVLYAISQGNIQASFNYLEKEEVEEELARGLKVLEEDRKALETITADWAIWDDTYRFLDDRNAAFVRSNISIQSFETVHVSVLLFYDTAGRLVFGRSFNPAEHRLEPAPVDLARQVAASPLMRGFGDGDAPKSGLLTVSGRTWILAACPVLTSLRQGPSRGVLVMGRRLDPAKVKALSDIVMLDLGVTSLNIANRSPHLKDIVAALVRTGHHQLVPDGDARIRGYALLRDVTGQPALLFSVTMSRRIHLQEQITQRNNFLYLLMIGMVFGLAMLYVVERRVLSRVTGLSDQIDRLGQTPGLVRRTFVSGHDEIAGLSTAINGMLAALDHARRRYELATRAAKVGVWEYVAASGEFYLDPSFWELLGVEPGGESTLGAWLARVHPEDRERIRAGLTAFLAGGQEAYMAEHRMVAGDGAVRWILVRGRVVRDEAGAVARIVGTNADVTELKAAEANIRELTGDLIAAQENERARIARDLHDNVAQCLSVAKIAGETLLDDVDAPPAVAARVTEFSALLARAIGAVREISYDLRPPDLEYLGLSQAMERLCEDFAKLTGLAVVFEGAGLDGRTVDPNVAINLYRVVQEALANVRRHAAARQVSVRLVESYPKLIVRIKDDGRGFDVAARPAPGGRERHMGLVGMRERMELLGGRLRVVAEPGQGCLIVAEVVYTGEGAHGKQADSDR